MCLQRGLTRCDSGAAATVGFAIWMMYDKLGRASPESRNWEVEWVTDGYWHLLFFFILLAIMFLWRPTLNNKRYAYAALEVDLDEEPESVIIPSFGLSSHQSCP